MKILILSSYDKSLINFRGPLLKSLVKAGNVVVACAPGCDTAVIKELEDMGVSFQSIPLKRADINPIADIYALFCLYCLMRKQRPDMVLSYMIKPVIYGGLTARLCGVRSIYSLVTGLGYAFKDAESPRQHMVGWLARSLYRMSLCHSRRVFFQNPDDNRKFVKMGLVTSGQGIVVNGSGVDLSFFPLVKLGQENPSPSTPIRFLLIARLLRDKGIGEYAAAARIVKMKHPSAEFVLVGGFDPNPTGLKPEEVKAWEAEGLIDHMGEQKDVRPFIHACHVYVLPSYYLEGTPRTVLEAMATGRAVITTDAPGCRETVSQAESSSALRTKKGGANCKIGRNGILIPTKDVEALAAAMEFFIDHPEQIEIMGRESRVYAEQRYDVHKVNSVMLQGMGLM